MSIAEPGDVVLVYDERGNAFDAFPYDPDSLTEKAAEARGNITFRDPLGIISDLTSSLAVRQEQP